MAANAKDYRPLLFSERVEPNDVGQFDLCRAAALAMGFDAATMGEWTTNANGSRWGKAKIKKALERMRAATGAELRGSYNQGHMDDFLRGIRAPVEAYQQFNRPMTDIKDKLETHVIFLAGDVKHTRAQSPLRRYVNGNVGHEIILVDVNKDGTQIAFIDPMTPHGTAKYVRWAPVEDFRKFGSEFREGKNYIAGAMRRGQYTAKNILKRTNAKVILKLQTDLLALQKAWQEQQAELIVQDKALEDKQAEITLLETELAAALAGSEVEPLESEIDRLIDRLDRIKAITLE